MALPSRVRSPVSSGSLAVYRTIAVSRLPDLCTIERSVDVSDDQGGWISTWSDLVTNVPCRVRRPASGAEVQIAGRLTNVVPLVVMLPAGQDVGVRDRIVVTSQPGMPRLEVQVALGPMSSEVNRTVLCDAERL